MASTILQPLADLIATKIEALATTVSVNAYSVDPGFAGLDSLPVAVIGLPQLERTEPDESESQIGSFDYKLEYPVTFLFDLGDSATAQAQALDTVEKFVAAIDAAQLSAADPSIVDAKVVRSDPGEVVDAARPLLSYSCTLRVLKYQS
jgi:hypothetical protein